MQASQIENSQVAQDENQLELFMPSEVWFQDSSEPDLWHGPLGVIVNTAALKERQFFYRIIRRNHQD